MYVIGIWGVAGIFIISAVSGYYSPSITVWEPVLASVGLVVLMAVAASLHYNRVIVETTEEIAGLAGGIVLVFALSYLGAWWGERLQNLRQIIEEHPIEIEGAEETGEAPGSGGEEEDGEEKSG